MKLSQIHCWKRYCSEPLDLIENYQKALAENFKGWCMHHRLEIQPDGTRVSAKELIDQGLYYGRPAEELIFMRFEEHSTLHHKGENNYWFGKHHSAETRKKMRATRKGKPTCIKGTNWYNNGVKSIRAKTCPEGFVKGRLKQHTK